MKAGSFSATEDEELNTDATLTKTGTNSTERDSVETISHGRTTEDTDYIFGINTDASDPKPSGKSEGSEGGQTGTTVDASDVVTYDTADTNEVTETKDNDKTEHEEIHRYGNIGVTTTQKLIQEERNLWLWNYFDQIFSDLDRELALAFHDPCRV